MKQEIDDNFYIKDDFICNLIKPQDDLFILFECFRKDNYYRFDFKIENDKLKIEYISTNKELREDVNFKFLKNGVYKKNNELILDSKVVFGFYDGDLIGITLDNRFDLTKPINKYRYDNFDKLNDKFTLQYIKDLIVSGQLYSNQRFVYNNISFIFDLIKTTEQRIAKQKIYELDFKGLEKVISTTDTIEMVQTFLNKYNIDININKFIVDEVITFKEKFSNNSLNGRSYFDKENNKKLITVNKTNDLLMLAVLVHEILHYTNQPIDNNRSEASEFLTEVISYSYELIMLYELLETKYKNDSIYLLYKIISSFFYEAYFSYAPILSIKLIKENGDLLKEEIKKNLSFDKYKDEMRKCIMEKRDVAKATWDNIGYFLAISNFIEYKKDNTFINKISELNNSINNKTFKECLNILGINDLNDIFKRCFDNVDEYMDWVKKLHKTTIDCPTLSKKYNN